MKFMNQLKILMKNQILRHSKIPAEISEKIFDQSKEWAILIAEELKYMGHFV